MKSLSVVTVCLNAAEHIEGCLRSVREQSFGAVEHIVIDGGSTDGTVEIVESRSESLSVFVSEPDGGLYNAMNKGAGKAKGDVLFFLNADDRFCDREVAADVMRAFDGRPGTEALFGDQVFDLGGTAVVKIQPRKVARRGLARTTIQHQTLFVRRELFGRVGPFREDLKVVSDYEWILRAFLSHRCRYLHLPREISVMHTGGLSWNTDFESERLKVMKEYFSFLEIAAYRTLPRVVRRMPGGLGSYRMQVKGPRPGEGEARDG